MPQLRCSDVWGGSCTAPVQPPTFLCGIDHKGAGQRPGAKADLGLEPEEQNSEMPNNIIDFARRRGWDDWEMVQSLLNDPTTSEQVLEEIWVGRNKALAVAMKLLESRRTSPSMVRRVWESWWMDERIQTLIANHRNTPADIFVSLWKNHHVIPVGIIPTTMADLPGGWRHLALFSQHVVPADLVSVAIEDGRYETSATGVPDEVNPSNLVPMVASGMIGTWDFHRQLIVRVCEARLPDQIAVGALGLAMINWRSRRIGFTELTNRLLDAYPNSEDVQRSVSMVLAS